MPYRGTIRSIKAHTIPVAGNASKGVPLPQVKFSCVKGDIICAMLPMEVKDNITTSEESNSNTCQHGGLILFTKNGRAKRIPIETLEQCDKRRIGTGVGTTKLTSGDAVMTAILLPLEYDVLLITRYNMKIYSMIKDVNLDLYDTSYIMLSV